MTPPKKQAQDKGKGKGKQAAGKGGKPAKAKKKKWVRSRVKERTNNSVFLDAETHAKMFKDVPKLKLITPSSIMDKFKVNGSVARLAIREMMAKGLIRQVSHHNMQSIYTRVSQ